MGRFPIDIVIKDRIISFGKELYVINKKTFLLCFTSCCITCMLNSFSHPKWISCIENTLNICVFSEYWISQGVPKNVSLSSMVKQRLCDQYKQTWYEIIFNTAKCLNYRIF